ncbi:MAG: outer membrane beta-barrel protein [Bacteroidia bacterium]|nr:outer membrane beta-barrel protein [Bacteroidia bacterium]
MKKILFTFISVSILCASLNAQTNTTTPTPEVDRKEAEFDKKFRFGIRATPQPTWYKSDNNNSKGAGATFGFGFGLIMEFRLSKIIHFSTGIGGDFEGGYISYRNDNDFNVNGILTSEGEYVESKDGKFTPEQQLANGNTQYILKERRVKTTFVTIPLILKMMTDEYSGARYFANAGLELGIRAKTQAKDSYVSGIRSTVSGTNTTTAFVGEDELTKSDINIGKDASLAPLRLGMNLGLGMEYRLGGSTSLLFSANYFQSFTNLMRKDSKYLVKATVPNVLDPLNQGLFMRAVRINIGLLF